MKYRELEYSRTFNLGDYQSERITLIVDLDETEDLDESFKTLKASVFRLQQEGELLEESRKVVESNKAAENLKHAWNPERIRWSQAEGARGPYLKFPGEGEKAESTEDYRNMLADLKAHGGKMTRDGCFFWVFTDGATVGKKRLN